MSQLNFLYSQTDLKQIAADIIQQAVSAGASSAQVEVSESISTNVEILQQQIENFETSHDNQVLLTVFKGHKKGNVGISSIELDNLAPIIQQALDIANYTQEDPANGLLEREYLQYSPRQDLQLYHECNFDNQELITTTQELEQLALNHSPLLKASDGASTTLTRYNFVTANSNDFNHGYQTSRYSKYVSLIGENQHGMQTDYWYSSNRAFNELLSNHSIAQTAAKRVLRRLERGSFAASKPNLIFETTIAKSIIGSLISALSGNSLYRRLSFLNDSLGQTVLPSWLNIVEDPYIVKGLASCYYDNEGCQVQPRFIIGEGVVNSYLLSSYSARKLNLTPTGNAGGSHNLIVNSNFEGGLDALSREMGNGIIIIETIGHGLNLVTGDYSVGASGLVVNNGVISHYVDNLTIAGNLRDILANISLIANDSDWGSIDCGSMLINQGVIQVSC